MWASANPNAGKWYYSLLDREETGAQRGSGASPRSHSRGRTGTRAGVSRSLTRGLHSESPPRGTPVVSAPGAVWEGDDGRRRSRKDPCPQVAPDLGVAKGHPSTGHVTGNEGFSSGSCISIACRATKAACWSPTPGAPGSAQGTGYRTQAQSCPQGALCLQKGKDPGMGTRRTSDEQDKRHTRL